MATKKKLDSANASETMYRTPAAILAAKEGKPTYIVNIAPFHNADDIRVLEIDDNPRAHIPTDEDVEVAENEYVALLQSAEGRKRVIRLLKTLEQHYNESGTL